MTKAEEAALKAYPGQLVTTCARGNRFHAGPLLRIGFVEGYEQAEKDLGWISVKDRKPAPSEWVVVCHKDHGVPQCLALATYNEETGEWHTDDWEDGEREIYFPDYWMPIPKFKEEKK